MAQTTIKAYVYWQFDEWMSEPEFVVKSFKAIDNERLVFIKETMLIVDIPDDFDPRGQQVAALEKQKQELQAKFTAAVTEINARINKLLAISNDAEVTQ